MTMNRTITWMRSLVARWSTDTDRDFHDALFEAQDHDPFSVAYFGNITVRRFADLAEPHLADAGLVLDLGCGPAEITCELAHRKPETRFVAVDHSAKGIERARANADRLGLRNIEFEVADGEQYEPREPVDIVTMFDSFHHLLEPRRFIERLGSHTQRFLLIEPRGDWKGSWSRQLDFDWIARDLEKIRVRIAALTGESGPPGAAPAWKPPDPGPGCAEPVENRYDLATLTEMFAGYGLQARGTISGLDEYPPEPSLDTSTRREFGELMYGLYASVDSRLFEQGLDLFAKHLVVYAEAGAQSALRRPLTKLPAFALDDDIRGPHEVVYLEYEGPEVVTAGAEFYARTKLKNASWRPLSSADEAHPDLLSYHWLDQRHEVVIMDGERNRLPHDVPPGDEVDVAMKIRAPEEPGRYVLALDLVQEGKTWFRDAGTPCHHVAVRVSA